MSSCREETRRSDATPANRIDGRYRPGRVRRAATLPVARSIRTDWPGQRPHEDRRRTPAGSYRYPGSITGFGRSRGRPSSSGPSGPASERRSCARERAFESDRPGLGLDRLGLDTGRSSRPSSPSSSSSRPSSSSDSVGVSVVVVVSIVGPSVVVSAVGVAVVVAVGDFGGSRPRTRFSDQGFVIRSVNARNRALLCGGIAGSLGRECCVTAGRDCLGVNALA